MESRVQKKIKKLLWSSLSSGRMCGSGEANHAMRELGCQIFFGMVEECNAMLEDSVKQRIYWQIKNWCKRHLLTSLETISFTHTRFEHNHRRNRLPSGSAPGTAPSPPLSEEAKTSPLDEAVQGRYEKDGWLSGGEGWVTEER